MKESRGYRSPHRERQAQQTRRAILEAARKLFAEQGYAATPVTQIARHAGVSVPTLYASVGTKAELARRLVEFVNDEGGVAQNDARQRQATSAPELLRLNMHLVRELNERCGDIMRAVRSAAHTEPELAPVAAAGDAYHRDGEHEIARRLLEMKALRAGLSVEQAGAILSTLASSETIDQLVLREGWSYDEVEDWLVDSLSQLLLGRRAGRRKYAQ
ncbi:MAG: TetR/AcrR family transcriptional regulator [Intrasporangium sp.]|uniref:TetR/AcrR family transcriptional regulator n=1 Tax=Intrasporangium sp. TaxID=1925024 RepID=UPI002648C723|nr:TetR/AcrR family transcriptional regulator [Intrasporangium sp.]MDN5794753.1 TetR/AcrR family transcriptional regulator [Intrasporangium sp.]